MATASRLCLQCRYQLDGLTGAICPECGRPFNPRDPTTYYQSNVWMIPSWLSKPPDRGHLCLAVAASFLSIRAVWFGPADALYGIPAIGLWLALGALILPKLAVRVAVPRTRHRLGVDRKEFWRRSAAPLGVLLGTTLLLSFNGPQYLRFLMLYTSLRAVADQMRDSPATVLDLERRKSSIQGAISAFKVPGGEAIEVWPIRGSLNWDRYWSWEDSDGFARLAPGAPLRIAPFRTYEWGAWNLDFRHITGDWYWIRWEHSSK